ncbi:RhuM family protein [Pedobacter sp. MC2016-24]|uniref:RhuM family protein n=1 Tax=Pedobacter sp. MC2016-24 TaxID=2780090 RepID=UPI001881F885|nr:RhuM family protein [Pedobacter sp. MC2016-24]MBE9602732.1 virulence RhuM family protein [Pedobacter sp. MC2016-24]
MTFKDQITIYQTNDGTTSIEVKLENETIWLNQAQITNLFKRDRTVITKHINNIFKEKELEEKSNVQKMHIANSDRPVNFYSLDVIISVGYRVKSLEGTKFRIWANKILKEYLVKGYSLNEMRLREQNEQLNSLKNTVNLLSTILENKSLNTDEATGLLRVVTDYAYALSILDKYDHQQLIIEGTTAEQLFVINYVEAKQAIHDLKDKFGGSSLFGNEKDESFKSSIATIYQTFNGIDLYPSVEEKAANLLYFVVYIFWPIVQ